MLINGKEQGKKLTIKIEDGGEFHFLEVGGKLFIEVLNDRIMYSTEQGNNNADYIILVK